MKRVYKVTSSLALGTGREDKNGLHSLNIASNKGLFNSNQCKILFFDNEATG